MMGQIPLIKSARAYVEYNVEHIKQEVQALFATPIYFSQLERNFSNEELQFIENSKKDCVVNINKNKISLYNIRHSYLFYLLKVDRSQVI